MAAPDERSMTAKEQAARGLGELVPDALAVLGAVLRTTKAQRNVGAKVAAARYVLDVVLQLPAATDEQSSGARNNGQARLLTPEAAVIELRRRLSTSASDGGEAGGA
jgi:hypothetical protein